MLMLLPRSAETNISFGPDKYSEVQSGKKSLVFFFLNVLINSACVKIYNKIDWMPNTL